MLNLTETQSRLTAARVIEAASQRLAAPRQGEPDDLILAAWLREIATALSQTPPQPRLLYRDAAPACWRN